MIKLVGLLKRNPQMSRDDFISHYELRHVPLTLLLAAPGHDYRRNYPQSGPGEVGSLSEYDVITEAWFENHQAYEAYAARMRLPTVKARLEIEEERCLDRARCRTFIVDEFITETAPPGSRR